MGGGGVECRPLSPDASERDKRGRHNREKKE